jgi:hypothetical protein
MLYKRVYFATRYFIAIAGVIFFSFLGQKASAGDMGWSTHDMGGRVLYVTHGTDVSGNQLGFIKDPGNCSNDTLSILWYTSDINVQEHNLTRAVLEVDIDGAIYRLDADMLSAEELNPTKSVISFTSLSTEPEFIENLIKGNLASLKITGPEELTEHLELSTDNFSLIGFTAKRNLANKFCRKATY